jgi:serine/threonine-protein kinase
MHCPFAFLSISGLQYLSGVLVDLVHCDLKPANILLTQTKQLKIADFNLTRSVFQTKSSAGTIHYMPPERFLSEQKFVSI